MPSSPSLGWERLQNVFYRSRPCFELNCTPNSEVDQNSNNVGSFPSSLEDYMVSIGPYASHIALYERSGAHYAKPTRSIDIYLGSGNLVCSLPWLVSIGEIVALGWRSDCSLIVVMRSGKWRIYHKLDGDFDEYDLQSDDDLLDVRFWENGFMARLANNTFTGVLDYDKPKSVSLEMLAPEEQAVELHGWDVISPNANHSVDIMVGINDSVNLLKDSNTSLAKGPYDIVSLPPNKELVALYSHESREITIATADLKRTLNIFKSDNESIPLQLQWCGNDAVIVSYKDEMKLVGPSKDSLDFYLDFPAILHSEPDGLYYLCGNKLSFISRVKPVTLETFKIGSTAPSAILLDAMDLLDQHSPKANENLEIISDFLVEAVDGCIRAAAEEFEPYWQKKLLNAASFGKTTIDLYNSEEFVETCNYLRVLNIVRQPEIGMFITYTQFLTLGAQNLIKILLLHKEHFLCLKLADFLDLPKGDILLNWADCKIKTAGDLNDEQLANIIIKRLAKKRISFASIAEVAYQEGRKVLSIKLLNEEIETAKSIPLLLEMDQDDYALVKAEDDMDVDSILYVLLTLYNKLNVADFFKILDGKPNSTGVFKANLVNMDQNLLYNYYYQDDFIPGLAELDLKNFFDKDSNGGSLEAKRVDLLKASRLLLRSKSTNDDGQRLKDEVKLVEAQDKLHQDEIMPTSRYEPVMKTIERIILVDLRKAIRFQKTHKVPDRQFYHKVVKTLAPIPERRHELYEFATSKKSPIGYEPFYLELLKVGDKRQAAMYVKLCTDISYKARVHCYLKCDDFKSAVEEAAKKKDSDLLEAIKSLTDNQVYLRLIDDSLETITGAGRFG
ncbi:hypothetical protein FOA43_002144 [Brettanomyces nanus]|uniref:Probable vacuolar protein sorting-associated protein 16 homolog n=1 Tax=Eeniella nana TaxID=13502 RepID=A0A875S1I2_EENNA|nr:uncharacterized protein FOA43_002144 [Brettanomyces nanus]QPG74808.1 hypothetical protein FOA43_002144 [Brettanomyces nanus]